MANITTSSVGNSMLADIISQTAVLQLAQSIVSTRKTTRLFGGRREGLEYVVPNIVGDGARTRSIGGSVTASTNTVADVRIPVSEMYYTVDFDRRYLDSEADVFAQQFARNGANQLANKVEQTLWGAVAQQAGLGASNMGGANLELEDFNSAMVAMGNIGVPMSDRCLVTTWTQNTVLMDPTAFPGFAQYQIGGLPNTQSGGVPGYTLRGYAPEFTSNLNNSQTGIYTGQLNGAINDSVVSIPVDTLSVSGGVKIGDVWNMTVSGEQMLVIGVPTSYTTAGTFTVKRGVNGTSPAASLDNAAFTVVDGYSSLYFQRNDIVHVFAPILVNTSMLAPGYGLSVSTMSFDNGGSLDLGVIQEPVLGTNGGTRLSMFTVAGMQAIRPAAVIRAVTTA